MTVVGWVCVWVRKWLCGSVSMSAGCCVGRWVGVEVVLWVCDDVCRRSKGLGGDSKVIDEVLHSKLNVVY